MRVLGIETSCDETGVAVYDGEAGLLAHALYSQAHIHAEYGGVVPEIASRDHVRKLLPRLDDCLARADCSRRDIDGVAYTAGPGLIGALLVGASVGRAIALSLGVPAVAVHHMEGHLLAPLLEPDPPEFPFVALLVSGGHSMLVEVSRIGVYRVLGETLDDAAGEAFDKTAKLLGLGYPGGRIISELAAKGDPAKIVFKRTYLDKNGFDFSFSGIKTGVGRYIQLNKRRVQKETPDIASGFQESVVDVLSFKLMRAASVKNCSHVAIVGGVAANRRLREKVTETAQQKGKTVHIPPASLCGDNAAMIAVAGFHHLAAGESSGLDSDVYSRSSGVPC